MDDPIEDEFAEAIALANFKAVDDEEFENAMEVCHGKKQFLSFA